MVDPMCYVCYAESVIGVRPPGGPGRVMQAKASGKRAEGLSQHLGTNL